MRAFWIRLAWLVVSVTPTAALCAQTASIEQRQPISVIELSPQTLSAQDPQCAAHRTTAIDSTKNLFDRARAARNYRLCIETQAAKQIAARQPSAQRVEVMAVQAVTNTIVNEAKELEEETSAAAKFMDLSWGLGFGFSFGSDDGIEEAEMINGLIRVTKDRTNQPRVLLEFHRFFWCNEKETLTDRGCGPFLAVAATQDKVLSGVGVGFMYGRRSKNPTSEEGFSIGLGGILDGDVKSLAEGFHKNQALPSGETTIRFEEKARWAALVFVTRSF